MLVFFVCLGVFFGGGGGGSVFVLFCFLFCCCCFFFVVFVFLGGGVVSGCCCCFCVQNRVVFHYSTVTPLSGWMLYRLLDPLFYRHGTVTALLLDEPGCFLLQYSDSIVWMDAVWVSGHVSVLNKIVYNHSTVTSD